MSTIQGTWTISYIEALIHSTQGIHFVIVYPKCLFCCVSYFSDFICVHGVRREIDHCGGEVRAVGTGRVGHTACVVRGAGHKCSRPAPSDSFPLTVVLTTPLGGMKDPFTGVTHHIFCNQTFTL